MTAEPPEAAAWDRRLISAVIRGDPDALDTWYRREHPQVFRVALGFLARWEDAEDLSQDAMLHLLDHLSAWDRKRPFRAWRNAVVANLCRDRLRRLGVRRRVEGDTLKLALPQRLPAPGEQADTSELRELVTKALRKLTDREREVFVLRDLEGCPSEEVSAALGIQESTVRSLLSLARSRLRRLLGPRLVENREE